jgi:hypothetical protein
MAHYSDGVTSAVRELAEADVVAFGGVGLVGRILPVTEAYQHLADLLPDDADRVRPQLAWLLANGSAAGKAYAATLMERIDPDAARSAWRSLSGDRTSFTTFQGCLMNRTTLAAYAGARTSG